MDMARMSNVKLGLKPPKDLLKFQRERPQALKRGNKIVGSVYELQIILLDPRYILFQDGSVIEFGQKSTEASTHKDGITPVKETAGDDVVEDGGLPS
ncbi:hypothetical protein L2E82_08061 [Cichorium intybus]|uniref:Uncharacterized protein n=1 Tax=Cichorium intybus TaxID=13427 RepID=A0ACB9G650_CICIN|nr:hypothetical protein L2E82_08061 [Cichorium intybus]